MTTTPNAAAHLRAGLAYASRGWHVFPLVPGTKRPAVTGWEQRATTSVGLIRRTWLTDARAPFGIGIACGPSGLVVLDLDVPKPDPGGGLPEPPADLARLGIRDGLDLFRLLDERHGDPQAPTARPLTFAVNTGRGGAHLYFTAPGVDEAGVQLRNTAGALGWLIDTRAAGGYVVAPPTVVDGRGYTIGHDAPAAPLPAWIAEALRPRAIPPPTTAHSRTSARNGDTAGPDHPYVAAAVDGQRRRIAAAAPGRRNYALYLSAVALGQLVAGGALEQGDAVAVLHAAADAHIAAGAYSEHQARQTITSGLRAGARRPRAVPDRPARPPERAV